MAIPDHLRSCPLFLELYDKEIEKIVKHCSVYTFEPGDAIFRENDESNEIFVLLEGEAAVEKNYSGEKVEIQPLKSGDVFGEMSLTNEKRRAADVVARSIAYVLEIRSDDIFKVFEKRPRAFGIILLNIARLMGKRLVASNQIIMNLHASRMAQNKSAS